ncbi:hypothetical protein BH11PLA1_BH11PLA1_11750 [soil metagenome]
MGAWGVDAFGNDAACDWSYTLEESDDLSVVRKSLEAAADCEEEFVDAMVGSEALAACEVVARLRGKFGVRNSYTETADKWVAAHPQAVSAALLDLAQRAIEAVLKPQSELRGLWDETGAAEEWLTDVAELRQRLN